MAISDPIPFEVMPISNTKAFGGSKFADNPVGIGFGKRAYKQTNTHYLALHTLVPKWMNHRM